MYVRVDMCESVCMCVCVCPLFYHRHVCVYQDLACVCVCYFIIGLYIVFSVNLGWNVCVCVLYMCVLCYVLGKCACVWHVLYACF